jgi:hypothetical protein
MRDRDREGGRKSGRGREGGREIDRQTDGQRDTEERERETSKVRRERERLPRHYLWIKPVFATESSVCCSTLAFSSFRLCLPFSRVPIAGPFGSLRDLWKAFFLSCGFLSCGFLSGGFLSCGFLSSVFLFFLFFLPLLFLLLRVGFVSMRTLDIN